MIRYLNLQIFIQADLRQVLINQWFVSIKRGIIWCVQPEKSDRKRHTFCVTFEGLAVRFNKTFHKDFSGPKVIEKSKNIFNF